jgi:hypothetical protein
MAERNAGILAAMALMIAFAELLAYTGDWKALLILLPGNFVGMACILRGLLGHFPRIL